MSRTRSSSTSLLTACCAAACVVLALVQMMDQGKYARVLEQRAQMQQLGEDKDWNVRGWSSKHKLNVAREKIDATSVKNIWHKADAAWAGINDVLPTGGRYAYEEDHVHTAGQARMLDYADFGVKQIKQLEMMVPKDAPAYLRKEVAETKDILNQEQKGLNAIVKETSQPQHPYHASKSGSQMLAQAQRQSAKRVYVDEAMYGEGIEGDMKPLGHKRNHWSSSSARKDMNSYFSQLTTTSDHAAASHKKAYHNTDQNMNSYFKFLDAKKSAQQMEHDNILKQDGYYHTHPFEHADIQKFIRDSYHGKSTANAGNRIGSHVEEEIKQQWVKKHGVPKTKEELAAAHKFEVDALEAVDKAIKHAH